MFVEQFPELVRSLQSEGKRYVNIIDPGISSTQPSGTYPPYDDGLKMAIFMTKFNSTEPIIGKVFLYSCRSQSNCMYSRFGQVKIAVGHTLN